MNPQAAQRPPGQPISQDPGQRQPTQASNVDNVDNKLRSGASNVDNIARSQPVRPSLFGRSVTAPASRSASNVDNVDILATVERDRLGILRELDSLEDDIARNRSAGRQNIQDYDLGSDDLEVIVDPASYSPLARQDRVLPSGPSPKALEAIRRSGKAKLSARARSEGVDPASGSKKSRESASPQARKGTTVSQATLDQYLRRGQLLFDRYRREVGIEAEAEETNPVEFVNWLMSLKPGLQSSTWRMYRQCAYHFVEGFPHYDTGRAVSLLDADVIDRSRQPKNEDDDDDEGSDGGKKARRTSAQKEKRFPIEDWERVQTYLRTFNRSRLAPVVADWLRAGILVGLRPIEWRACDLEIREDPAAAYGRRAFLYVLSAKATNGRGTGVVRTLDLSAFTDSDLECVRRMVDRARNWLEDGRYAEMQGQCSTLLYAATSKIWPNRRYSYCLYSARHQFIANMKAILQPAEIAALVGHGVTATAAEHYGKRRSSWPPERISAPPKPVPEELSVVRERIRLFERRLELEVKAGLRKSSDIPEFPLA